MLTAAANAYGFNPQVLDRVAFLESRRRPNAVNTTDSNAAAGHPSTGIVQFLPSTFDAYAKQARDANPDAWRGIPLKSSDWRAQLLAASWAMANGKGSAWSTFERAKQDVMPKWLTRKPGAASSNAARAMGGASSTPSSGGFSGPQKAVLAMVFEDNPTMQKLVGIREQRMAASQPQQTVTPAGSQGTGGGSGIVDTALAEVGRTANDAMRYIKAAGGKGYEPWCGDFVQWVFKQRGLNPPPARSVPALMAWASKNHRLVSNPRPGDLVTFDWDGDKVADHVEIVRGTIDGGVSTIGGNTSGGRGSSQVATKNRTSNILGYVRAA